MKHSQLWVSWCVILSISASMLLSTGCAQRQNLTRSQPGAYNAPGQGASTNLGRNPLTSDQQRRTGPLVGESANALGNRNANADEKPNTATRSANQPDLRVSQTTANAVRTIPGIAHAYVFYAGSTAYIALDPAATDNTRTKLTPRLKTQVTNKVKQQNKAFRTIFITTDPDAYHHFQGYASNVRDGQPVATGSWSQIYAVIHRVWPNQHT